MYCLEYTEHFPDSKGSPASPLVKDIDTFVWCAAIMHLLLHVIGSQADSTYSAYFPIGMFFIVLSFHIFFFIQRVVGPLLTPASAVATPGGTRGGSCCASAVPVPANLNKVRQRLPVAFPTLILMLCKLCNSVLKASHISAVLALCFLSKATQSSAASMSS